MSQPPILEDLSARISAFLEASPARDLEKNLRALLSAAFAKLDLATREDLDVQIKVLARTRENLTRLEARVAELEKRLEAAEKRADAVEALRGDVRQMRETLDRRVADVARRVDAGTVVASVPADAASGAMAAAVERPTPGNASMSFASVGKPLRAICRAAACRFRPRA